MPVELEIAGEAVADRSGDYGAAEDLPMPRGRGSLATMIERRSLGRVTPAKGKLAATTALRYACYRSLLELRRP